MKVCVLLLSIALISCDVFRSKYDFIKDIPVTENGEKDPFYERTKARSDSLHLENIEDGHDSLQIRLWYDYQLLQQRKLLVLEKVESKWKAYSYKLLIKEVWDKENDGYLKYKGENIKIVERKEVYPKSGWINFTTDLFRLKIMTLPHMDQIPGLQDMWLDGVDYNVEVATKNTYRFYNYHLPEKFLKYWQAKNMLSILKLVQDELNMTIDYDPNAEPVTGI